MPTSIRSPKTTRANATRVSLITLVVAAGLPVALAAQTTGQLAVVPPDTAATNQTPPEILTEVSERFAEIYAEAAAERDSYDACMAAAAITAAAAEVQRTVDHTAVPDGRESLSQSMCALTFFENAIVILGDAAQTHLRAQQGLEAFLADFASERETHEASRAEAEALLAEAGALREALVRGSADEVPRILAIPRAEWSDEEAAVIANFQIDLRLVQLDLAKGETLRAIAEADLERLVMAEDLVSAWARQSGLTARGLTVDIRAAINNLEIIKAGASTEARRQATLAMLEIVQRTDLSANPFPDMPEIPLASFAGGEVFADIPMPDIAGDLDGDGLGDLAAVFAEYGIDVTTAVTAQVDGGQ